jgi:hypothetical protein
MKQIHIHFKVSDIGTKYSIDEILSYRQDSTADKYVAMLA